MIEKQNPKNGSTKERISLVVEKLSKTYDDGTVAVKNLSFKLHDGEILGLIGPNGAGKTTTLKCLMNLVEPSEGEIRIKGFPAGTREAKASIAYIPEIPILYNDLTVREHLKFVTMAYRVPEKKALERIDRLLKEFDLQNRGSETPINFSKGMRKKVSIICALVHNAQVFLIDEPFTGLEPRAVQTLKNSILAAKEAGMSVLFSTHILDMAEKICDKFLILQNGIKIAEGSLVELRALAGFQNRKETTLEDIYIALTEPILREPQAEEKGQ